ncbi:MAG: outer membrane lipid asymmetry maintenance protein MlaD [Thiogranum sp.]|nr:outer membrane lipid asymmetry maintenance protein MlaD [Thiogranum sp.]
MHRFNVELIVGLFMVTGFLGFAYLSVRLGDVGIFPSDSYTLTARFTSISGLKEGASVEFAGVRVGKVAGISLDGTDYEAIVTLAIDPGIVIQDDSIASIRTAGLIGDKYVKMQPGGAERILQEGDEIVETESAVDLEELISKYIFQSE